MRTSAAAVSARRVRSAAGAISSSWRRASSGLSPARRISIIGPGCWASTSRSWARRRSGSTALRVRSASSAAWRPAAQGASAASGRSTSSGWILPSRATVTSSRTVTASVSSRPRTTLFSWRTPCWSRDSSSAKPGSSCRSSVAPSCVARTRRAVVARTARSPRTPNTIDVKCTMVSWTTASTARRSGSAASPVRASVRCPGARWSRTIGSTASCGLLVPAGSTTSIARSLSRLMATFAMAPPERLS
ncbi:hypothetical protein [Streptomyces sp. NPDC001380]|uniref:hypothetical protein n=1 Tax=Streptomyces sp. NPDC001380 TaxID=3364566 RepID=UPI0036A22C1A